ncbi:MAG TPA: long-chain-fatty-acid--CoA ligase [Acidimicrobiales bacterium]|nr:long-chain-fatty-acid--CoA ligase [Acidimicrobiales bacterium]
MTDVSTREIRCLADILRVHGAELAEQTAVQCAGKSLTFAEFYERAKAVAGALASKGVRAHDRVAVIDRNSIENLEVVFGAALVNAVVVNVNWRLAPPEILQILDDAQTELVIVGSDFFAAVESIESEIGEKADIVAIGEHARWEGYETWLASCEPSDPGAVAAPEDVAFQLYTSGTTGLPKGVMLTTSNLMTAWSRINEAWEFEPGRSVNLALMPMFHIAGLGWSTAGLYFGCRTVVLKDVEPAEILHVISKEHITHAFMVPSVIQFLLLTPGVEEADFSSLRKLVYGASPISAPVLEKALEVMGCDFVQVYGLTETTGAITQLEPQDHEPVGRPGLLRSCGRPYPWVEMRVVDNQGHDLPAGQVGELWTRSGQNMAGYWNNPDATRAVLDEEGWLRTGDAGYLDEDGFVYLHDRVKDMIVTGGENVYPAEVENVLMRHPGVADVAIFGVPDTKWGEAVKAAVVPTKPANPPSAEDLISFAHEYLAGYKCPKSIDYATALPRNPSGKLLKRELRAPYWEGVSRQIG